MNCKGFVLAIGFLISPNICFAHILSEGLLGVDIKPRELKFIASVSSKDLSQFDDDKNGHIDQKEVKKYGSQIHHFLQKGLRVIFSQPRQINANKLHDNFLLSNGTLIYQQHWQYKITPKAVSLYTKFGEWKVIIKKGEKRKTGIINRQNKAIHISFDEY